MKRSAWMVATSLLAAASLGAQFGPQDPQQAPGGYDAAADAGGAVDEAGPPVARLSVMSGEASVRRRDSGEWIAAVVNAPLLAGDTLATGPGGQVELQLDEANYLRLAGDTEVRLADLMDGRSQIQVAGGQVFYRGLRDSAVQTEISTPSVAVHPLRLAATRIEVSGDGSTRIIVRRGEAEVSTQRGTERVREGNMMIVRSGAGDAEYQLAQAPGRDGWDAWNEQRDGYLERAQSNRYVGQGIYGAEDLDAAGRWSYDPAYGNVWMPTVGANWAPYRDGRWVWVDYYGWTWVDDAPWGWAPFHYGSWYMRTGFGWAWYPGARYGRTWWRPGLVSFVGFGGGYGRGFGNIGWVPLGPREAYHPWYGRGRGGFNNFNVVNNANIAGIYRNARVPNGVTAVASQDFQRGAFRNHVAPNAGDLQRGGLMRGGLPVQAGANQARLGDRAATVAPRGDWSSQRFFTPSGNLAGRQPGGQAAFGNSGARGFGQVQPNGAQNPGWRRFGEPAPSGQAVGAPAQGQRGAFNGTPSGGTAGNRGWERFGTVPEQNGGGRFSGTPRRQYDRPGVSAGGGYTRPLQVAPPLVRQREQASGSYGGRQANRGGGGEVRGDRAPRGNGGNEGGGHGRR